MVILVSRGETSGYVVQTVAPESERMWVSVNAVAAAGPLLFMATDKGLFVWDHLAGRVSELLVDRSTAGPVKGVFSSGEVLLAVLPAGRTYSWNGSSFEPLAGGEPRRRAAADDERPPAAERYFSDSLLELQGFADLHVGLWEQEGLCLGQGRQSSWGSAAPLPPDVGAARPTAIAVDGAGTIACGLRARERGFLIVSQTHGEAWTVVPEFQGVPASLCWAGDGALLVGLRGGGATLVNLKDGSAESVAALSDCGRVNKIAAEKDGGFTCATDRGLIVLTDRLEAAARLGRRNGLANETVVSFARVSYYGKEVLVLLCQGRREGALTLVSKKPAVPPRAPAKAAR
jgi:hypothetical protein